MYCMQPESLMWTLISLQYISFFALTTMQLRNDKEEKYIVLCMF